MFSVEWLQSALNDLTNVWVSADSSMRRAITGAANQIEQLLTTAPEQQGESRVGGRRILFVKPLAAVYRVDPTSRTVTILSVWRFGPRRRK
ncbi:MAG TPA: type II toxin-antitoxin system RelE/ParE family toxin [Pirellulales bacterium]